jgi:hypothetical protein
MSVVWMNVRIIADEKSEIQAGLRLIVVRSDGGEQGAGDGKRWLGLLIISVLAPGSHSTLPDNHHGRILSV